MLDKGLLAFGALSYLLALGFFIFLIFLLIAVGIYIYISFAYMSIGKKAKVSVYYLAWIPVIGPLIVTSQAARMHWWPILLLIGIWIPIINIAIAIVLLILSTIWLWKTFEAIKKPGWWAILCLIPIVNLILLGIAAWSK